MKNVEKVRYMWNGIKVDGKLYKCWYSFSVHSYENDNDPHMTIHSDSCASRFPSEVHELFEVRNNTDSMTDYFESDSIRIDRTHPEWERVAAAHIKQEIHRIKVWGKRKDIYNNDFMSARNAELEKFKTQYATRIEPTPEAEVIELAPVPTVESITIEWSESGHLIDGTIYKTVEDADAALAGAAIRGHREGGYFKTQAHIKWSDNHTYTVRCDLMHPAYSPFLGIMHTVKSNAEYMVAKTEGPSDYDELLRRVS